MGEKITRENRKLKFETLQLHVGQEQPDPVTDARAVPIYQTSSYVFHNSEHAAARFGLADAGNIYGRLTNPTEDVFEKRIAALEGGVAALAVASGAAAVTYTIENLAQNGDHIVSAKNIYGGTYNLLAHTLPQYGITTTFVDIFDYDAVEAAIQENTKAVLIETLGNPNSDVVDIEKVAEIAHSHQIPLIIDSTFATPYLVRPIEYGADIVIHSATKFIGGHGTAIGGVIVDGGKFDWEASGKFPSLTEPNPSYHGISFTKAVGPAAFVTKIRAILLRDTGATISPFHSFLFLQGLETLSLRVERHVENALKVVDYLSNHPQVETVHHPSVSEDETQKALYAKYFPNGGGSIFTFEIKGDAKKAQNFIDNLELFSLLANVADVKSLVIHPATTTHSQCTEEELLDQGIQPNTIRLSIGTENISDIIEDLEEAFKAVQ
jgi:O-acetylhomoserine (thiol)-lyase